MKYSNLQKVLQNQTEEKELNSDYYRSTATEAMLMSLVDENESMLDYNDELNDYVVF